MKTTLIFALTFALVAVSLAKKRGGPPPCDANMLKMFCSSGSDERKTKMLSEMTAACKEKHEKMEASLKSDKDAACAKQSDVTTACADVEKIMEKFRNEMGKECRPKGGPGGPGGKSQ